MDQWLHSLRTRYWPTALAVLLVVMLFVLEPAIVDFFQKGHFNWVSLHSLAIARHSSLANGGVGYSCEWLHPDGAIHLDYFNRYPIVFAVVSRWLLSPWAGDGVAWLYAARQWMNVIFVATALALWWWLRALRFSRLVAMASVLFTLSAPVVLQYRNMFHFDQPALLAYVLLLLVVVRKVLPAQPDLRWYWWALCLAALSGRSAVVLIFSLVLPLQRGLDGPRGRLWLGVPIAFGTVGLATSYNIAWEAHLNAVAWTSTSVVQSAMRRLGLSGDGFSERNLERTRWLGGGAAQIDRLHHGVHAAAAAGHGGACADAPHHPAKTFLLSGWLDHRCRAGSGSEIPTPDALEYRRDCRPLGGGDEKSVRVPCVRRHGAAAVPVALHGADFRTPHPRALGSSQAQRAARDPVHRVDGRIGIGDGVAAGSFGAVQTRDRQTAAAGVFFSDLAAYRSGAEHRVPVQRDDQWFPRSPYAQCALLDAPLLIGEPSPDTPLSRPPVFPSRPD